MPPFRLFGPPAPLPFVPFSPTVANLPLQFHLAWHTLRLRQQQHQLQTLEAVRQSAKAEAMDESEIEVVVDDEAEERKCKCGVCILF
jgi:hypothetical protein